MALVKFFRGKGEFYTKEKYGPDALYFATDEKKIWLNGIAYGFNPDDLKNLDLVSTIDWVAPDTFTVVSTNGNQETFKIPEATKLENGTYQSGLISALDKEKLDNSKETYVLNGLTNLQEGANQDSIIKAVGSFEDLWEALNEGKDIIDLSFSTYKKPIYITGNFSSGNGGINLIFLESNVLSIYQVQYVNSAYALGVTSKTFQLETDSRFNTTAKTVFGAINELKTSIEDVKAQLEEEVVGIYHFKGAVQTINDLPIEGMEPGDTYMVREAFDFDENHYAEGTHVVWNGEKWVAMEGESGYSKKEADDKFVPWMTEEKKDILLPINGSITMIQDTETGAGGVVVAQRNYGDGNVTEIGNVRNKLTLNATERPQIDLADGSKENVAYLSEIRTIPNEVNIPIRTLKDKVYTQEEIFNWFGVTTVPELKQKIASGGIQYLRYGITLTGNPHYYKMPIEYTAFESANQIKLVCNGLDTKNDHPTKYEIIINLDGTVIEGSSNVKVSLLNLVTEDELTSTNKTFIISLDDTDEAKASNKEVYQAFSSVSEAIPVSNVFVKNKRLIGLPGATNLVPLTGVKTTNGQLHFYTDIPVQLQITDYPNSANFGNVDISLAEDGTTSVQTSNTLINSGGYILNYQDGGLVAKINLELEDSKLKLKGIDNHVISTVNLSAENINGVGEDKMISDNLTELQDTLSWVDVDENTVI